MAGVGVARSVPSVLSFEERKPQARPAPVVNRAISKPKKKPKANEVPSLFVLSGRKTWSDAIFVQAETLTLYIPRPSSAVALFDWHARRC